MNKRLQVSLTKEDLQNIISRFHFNTEDYDELFHLYNAISPLLSVEAYYSFNCLGEKISTSDYCCALITLGDGIDKLMNLYLEKEQIYHGYIIDCLGLELLSKAYESFVIELQKETNKWATELLFLGEHFPIEITSDFFNILKPQAITYNKEYQLTPSKSVSLILPLSSNTAMPVSQVCNTCRNCGNPNCLFRKPTTYGSMQIFN